MRSTVGAEAQGQVLWRGLDAGVNDVESLQGFDLSSEVTARVEDRLDGRWGKLSRKLQSGGVVGKGSTVTLDILTVLCRK